MEVDFLTLLCSCKILVKGTIIWIRSAWWNGGIVDQQERGGRKKYKSWNVSFIIYVESDTDMEEQVSSLERQLLV